MTPNIQLIRQSYAALETRQSDLATSFFSLLADEYPPARSWLPSFPYETKENLLLSLLQLVVENIHKPETLEKYLEHFGKKYLASWSDSNAMTHYRAIGERLIRTLEAELSECWSQELADEWIRTYNYAAGAIKRGACKSRAIESGVNTASPMVIKLALNVDVDVSFKQNLHSQIREAITTAVTSEVSSRIRQECERFLCDKLKHGGDLEQPRPHAS